MHPPLLQTSGLTRNVIGAVMEVNRDKKVRGVLESTVVQIRSRLGVGSAASLAAVPGRKQPPRPIKQLFGPGPRFFARMFQQKTDVTNQVSPTVLSFDVEVPRERTIG